MALISLAMIKRHGRQNAIPIAGITAADWDGIILMATVEFQSLFSANVIHASTTEAITIH